MKIPHLWIPKPTWFQSVDPETVDYNRHRGRKFWVFDKLQNKEIEVEALDLQVNIHNPRHIEIKTHGERRYTIPVIDFYYQLEGQRASKDEIEYFDQLEFEVKAPKRTRQFIPKGKKLWTPH